MRDTGRRWGGWLVVIGLAACGEDGAATGDTATSPGDTRSDTAAEVGDTAETGTDATVADVDAETTATATTDTTTGGDSDTTSGGRTVAGTRLEGLTITWDEDLVLCSAWGEAQPLAEERARKARIVIPAHAVASLDEDDLRAVSLAGITVERGPNAADRLAPEPSPPATEVWQLLTGPTSDVLSTTLAYDLGAAGVLRLTWSVGRATGDTTAVVVTPESWDLRFAWQPPGDDEAALLERCGGAPDFEDAVSVAVAQDEGKKRWATLVRYWRTNPGVDAGSYPVVMVAHAIYTSDGLSWGNEAWDYWSQTYVAQHHNWADASEVDFTRDLGLWHTFFRAPEEGATRIKRVELAGVLGGGGNASMTIDTQTGTSVTTEVLPIPEPLQFKRIDAAALGRELADLCEGGEVLAAGADEHRVQLMLCPAGVGGVERDLVGVVPVVWASEPTRSSKRVDAITEVDSGWDVAIGTYKLMVRRPSAGVITTEVRNAADEVVTSSYEEAGPLQLARPREETLTADNAEPALSLSLTRRWAGYGVGKSQLWAPVRFSLTYGGVTRVVTAWDRLAYTNTHHNWEDALVATADDGAVLRWHTSFMNGIAHEVSITGAGGETILAPTPIAR